MSHHASRQLVPLREASNDLMQVVFELAPAAVHDVASETVWATPVGPDRYCLQATPFYAYGYSYLDVVEAKLPADGLPVVRRSIKESGHSTYRILLPEHVISTASFDEFWRPLEALGCTFEEVSECYRSIDVPPEVESERCYQLLELGEVAGAWYFEVGHCCGSDD